MNKLSHSGATELLLNGFYENFAAITARKVLENEFVDVIYDLANGRYISVTDKSSQDIVIFRAAYVLETIYFSDKTLLKPYFSMFFRDFCCVTNMSAKRHFGKIMEDILRNKLVDKFDYESIAHVCVEWITEPKTKVAVQIWAVEILILLKTKVDWIDEILNEILEILRQNPSPAMQVRLRKWNKI